MFYHQLTLLGCQLAKFMNPDFFFGSFVEVKRNHLIFPRHCHLSWSVQVEHVPWKSKTTKKNGPLELLIINLY